MFENIHPLILSRLRTTAGLSDGEILEALSFFSRRFVEKKDYILRAGEVCRFRSYINRGCFRRYMIDDRGKEVILNFAFEEWWIGDLDSFQNQQPSIYYAQALEDSEILCLDAAQLEALCEAVPKFRVFDMKKIENSHFAMLKRLAMMQSSTPEEKYLALLKKYPEVFQRIPLHYIASYLGIEPESLSRLRGRLLSRNRKS